MAISQAAEGIEPFVHAAILHYSRCVRAHHEFTMTGLGLMLSFDALIHSEWASSATLEYLRAPKETREGQ